MVPNLARVDSSPWLAGLSSTLPCRMKGHRRIWAPAIVVVIAICSSNVVGVVGLIFRIPRKLRAACIVEQSVGNTPPSLGVRLSAAPPPHDLVPEVLSSKHRIHQRPEIAARSRIAVQIDAPSRLQQPAHLHEAHAHEAEERAHIVPPAGARRLDDRPYILVLWIVAQRIRKLRMRFLVPLPAVLERCARREGVRRRVEVPPLVERRVGRYQIDRLRIHGAHEVDVVPPEQGSVVEVPFWHVLGCASSNEDTLLERCVKTAELACL